MLFILPSEKRSQKRILESSYKFVDLLKQLISIMLLLVEFCRNAGLLKKTLFQIPGSVGKCSIENCEGASYTMQNRVGHFVDQIGVNR